AGTGRVAASHRVPDRPAEGRVHPHADGARIARIIGGIDRLGPAISRHDRRSAAGVRPAGRVKGTLRCGLSQLDFPVCTTDSQRIADMQRPRPYDEVPTAGADGAMCGAAGVTEPVVPGLFYRELVDGGLERLTEGRGLLGRHLDNESPTTFQRDTH